MADDRRGTAEGGQGIQVGDGNTQVNVYHPRLSVGPGGMLSWPAGTWSSTARGPTETTSHGQGACPG
jgi:hypothetical protein